MAKTYRTFRRSRRNKKRNGGMLPSSSKSISKSKSNARVLFVLPGGVDSDLGLKALATGPDSGMVKLLSDRLLNPTSLSPDVSLHIHPRMTGLMHSTMSRVEMEGLANEICKRAERLRATSFSLEKRNVAECVQTNRAAVEQLKQAISMGSLRARACLADMLFNGNTVGVDADVKTAILLVSHYTHDPDCAGVLAQYRFRNNKKEEAKDLAVHSAAAGSKYGQFVLGLLEGARTKAFAQFALAAGQNYDEAQIALSELCLQGYGHNAPDEAAALRWLDLAARQGNKRAFHFIATIHSQSAMHANRYIAAQRWFGYCIDAGVRTAQDELNNLKFRYAHLHQY